MNRNLLKVAIFALALTVLAGCGGGRTSVEGTVTFNGESVDDGGINFIPEDGSGKKSGGEIKDGKYSISTDRGPPPGKYKVEIYWNKKTGKTVIDKADTGAKTSETSQVIPAQFNTSTTLTTEIKSGKNAGVNFDLKGTAVPPGTPAGGPKGKAAGDS